MNKLFRLISAPLLIIALVVSSFGIFVMQTSAAPLIQSYSTDKPLLAGTVVFIDTKTGYVEAASTQDNRKVLGVVVGVDDPQPGLNNSINKVLVARSGRINILVADVNGSIKKGDKISTSQIPGVSMKLGNNETAIGVAQEDYDGSKGQTSYEVTNDAGVTKTANSAVIQAELKLPAYDGGSGASSTSQGDGGDGVTVNDKNIVSSTAAIISVIAVLILIVIMVIIVYTNVRSSFISIGRNPLEQKGIPKELNRTLFTALGFIAACIVTIYLIAKF